MENLANKFVTLTGACQSMTSFSAEKKMMIREAKQKDLQDKRMAIILSCPSIADFYEGYLTKNAKKSKKEVEFDAFVNKYPKRFEGFA